MRRARFCFCVCNGKEDMAIEEGDDGEGSAVSMEILWYQMETWS